MIRKKLKKKVYSSIMRLILDLLIPMKGVEEDFDESNAKLDRILEDLEDFRAGYQKKYKYTPLLPHLFVEVIKSSSKISERRFSKLNVQLVFLSLQTGVFSPLQKQSNVTGRQKSKRKFVNFLNAEKHIRMW